MKDINSNIFCLNDTKFIINKLFTYKLKNRDLFLELKSTGFKKKLTISSVELLKLLHLIIEKGEQQLKDVKWNQLKVYELELFDYLLHSSFLKLKINESIEVNFFLSFKLKDYINFSIDSKGVEFANHFYLFFNKERFVAKTPDSKISLEFLSQKSAGDFFESFDTQEELKKLLLFSHIITERDNNGFRDGWDFHDHLFLSATNQKQFFSGGSRLHSFPGSIDPKYKTVPLEPTYPEGLKNKDSFKLINRRRTFRSKESCLSLKNLSELLSLSAVFSHPTKDDACASSFPSAGGIHELSLYVLDNEGIIREFDRERLDFSDVCSIREDDLEVFFDFHQKVSHKNSSDFYIVFVATNYERVRRVYKDISLKNSILSAGALVQNLQLVGKDLSADVIPIGVQPCEILKQYSVIDYNREDVVASLVIS